MVSKIAIICSFLCLFSDSVFAERKSKNIIYDYVDGTVDYVIDGDTFSSRLTLYNGITVWVKVRILGIDAPELSGSCKREIIWANQSKQTLKNLLPKGTKIKLKNIKDDKYLGRIDADVYKDDTNIGQLMLDKNMARSYDGGKRMSWCYDNFKQ